MNIPRHLQDRSFAEWNYLVEGLMEVWNLAGNIGLQDRLDSHLAHDHDGAMTEILAQIGHECAALTNLMRARGAGIAEEAPPVLFAVSLACQPSPRAPAASTPPAPAGAAREVPPMSIVRRPLSTALHW